LNIATSHDGKTAFGPSSLKAVFAGEHAWCGEKMMLSDDLAGAMPILEFFRSGAFSAALDRYAAAHGGSDRRALASMWSLYYFSALAIPYIVARRAERVLPVSLDRMTVALADDGLPQAFGLPDDGDWSEDGGNGDLMSFVMPLICSHLSMVVAELKTHGGIAPKLAWNNAAVYIDYAFNATETGPSAHGDAWASRPLFDCPQLPDGSKNPFHGCLRHEIEGGQTLCRRKICCLRYLLPGVPSCGELCALPSQRNA